MLTRSLTTKLLQIFELTLYSKVMFISMRVADVNVMPSVLYDKYMFISYVSGADPLSAAAGGPNPNSGLPPGHPLSGGPHGPYPHPLMAAGRERELLAAAQQHAADPLGRHYPDPQLAHQV